MVDSGLYWLRLARKSRCLYSRVYLPYLWTYSDHVMITTGANKTLIHIRNDNKKVYPEL